MHLRLCFQLIIVAQICATILGESHYSIIAPGTIRSLRKYSVGVTLHQADKPAIIRISIRSPTTSLNLSQDVSLQPFESKLIEFMPPQLLDQFTYELHAEGISGISLNKTSLLYALEYGGPRIFIESDRGKYKPDDTVHFRIFILDEHLRPFKIKEPIRVQILDANKNRVKQFKDIQLKHGVFAASFPLSKQPLLGEWSISVYISGKYNLEQIFRFDVEKYVLPKFSVHVESDPYFIYKVRFVKATVYAKYTFGKYVEGTAQVYVLNAYDRDPDAAQKYTVEIANGNIKTDVFLDIGQLNHASKLVIVAIFKEHLTNITAQAETTLEIRYGHCNIIIPESSIEFRDKYPYRFKAQVQYWNGTAVRDQTKPLTLTLGDKKYSAFMNSEGVAQFEFEYEATKDFWIYYDDSSTKMSNIYGPQAAYNYEVQTCKIIRKELGTAHVIGAPLEFEITHNKSMPYLIYALVSHGNIIREEYIRLPSNQKSYTIKLNVTIDLILKSYLYVHYIENNELRYCEFTILLPQEFENQITLEAPTSVKPGQEITMIIRGQPKSQISIVGVDKSSLLLSSDNLLKKSSIMKGLLYDRAFLQQRSRIYHPGYVAGVITLTSAKYETKSTYPYEEPWPQEASEQFPRSIFPETWIFEDMEIDGSNTSLKLKVPDTITTWIVRAFTVNDQSGFGMLDSTLNIQAFQPFFITTNLPYAVKRGEIITIPITIFNYLQQKYETEVSLDNTKQEFTFLDVQNKPIDKNSDMRTVTIPANNGKSVAFTIKPKKIGDIELKITAKNSNTSDAIIQKLKIEPEGLKKQYNQDVSLNLKQGKNQKSIFYAQIPLNIVPDSEYMVFSVSGDILVSTLENLEDLVQKPTGCGEQNMINLVPNILILDYLKALNKFDNFTKLVAKAKKFIETGYQQELTYRHSNGGYSVFGPKGGRKESNWLTAYVTRFFIKGFNYSAIETRIIESGLEFLAQQQSANGSFPQRGYLFHPSHQNEYGFSAFVLMTFLENAKYAKKYSSVVDKGMQYLTSNLNKINDAYALAIVANVFQATTHTRTNEVIEKLKQLAHEENGLMWWSSKNKKESNTNSVEITAYAFMALLETSGQYGSIFNWLLKQRNSRGGFGSTQDTVVGLQALIKYAKKTPHASTDETQIKLSYVAKNTGGENIKENFMEVNTENQLILQQEELPSTTRSVDVEIMGQGKIFLQFSYQYYVSADEKKLPGNVNVPAIHFRDRNYENEQQPQARNLVIYQYFIIKPIAKVSPDTKSLTVAICYTYQPQATNESQTNMVILQVQLPTSYVANKENIEQLKDEEQISRVDVPNPPIKLEIYFERLEANKEECLTVIADKMYEVSALKPSLIEMSDYYNPDIRGVVFYDVR